MAILQPIIDLVEICALHGVKQAILCPGSRSAALSLAFARNASIQCFSIADERSAGYMAIGMSLASKLPTAIICTSGTAAYNFAPAVAEAFFQEIPLLVFTADRPEEWIHQNDGQTIFQENIYGKHAKMWFQFSAEMTRNDDSNYLKNAVNEGISLCATEPKGPVHFNVAISEPFYPIAKEKYIASNDLVFKSLQSSKNTLNEQNIYQIANVIKSSTKILIAIGQRQNDLNNTQLFEALKFLQTEFNAVVLGDTISNIKIEHINNQDFLFDLENDIFQPELLITFGNSFISKSLKTYLRKYKAKFHWHLQENVANIDPLKSITDKIIIDPLVFLSHLKIVLKNEKSENNTYFNQFKKQNETIEHIKTAYFNQSNKFSELFVYRNVIKNIEAKSNVHLANSMAVRYANMIGFSDISELEIFSNRGTSGIDGCLSTAIGVAINSPERINVSLIGDMAFFYDRNAFWNNYIPKNLRVIVFNNQGGGIFRMIDGPSSQPELEEFFETKQNYTAKYSALEAGLEYYEANNLSNLEEILNTFFKLSNTAKLLEINTLGIINKEEFIQFKSIIKTSK